MGQLVGFFLHPPLSEIAKKFGKMYTPTFKVLSAPAKLHLHSKWNVAHTNL